jgi:uncharacterized protein DUF4159
MGQAEDGCSNAILQSVPDDRNSLRNTRSTFRFSWLVIAVSIPLMWSLFAETPLADNPRSSPEVDNTREPIGPVAEFQFARLRYPGGIPEFFKNWYTDYPAMDVHLAAIVQRLTGINVGPSVVVDPSSQNIFDYPLIYSVEPEQMVLGPADVTNLREYLARGGVWFADDFHGVHEFCQFLEQIHQVLPDASPVELDTSHPLFHTFYDIEKIVQVTNNGIAECYECDQWENGPSGKDPKVFAVLDQHQRISILMAWNTDLGDGLEWADDRRYPSNYSKYSYKFVTNVIVYAMTH